MTTRYFALCRGFEDMASLPKRSTKGSAGYDFFAAEDTVIPSMWKSLFGFLRKTEVKPTVVYTGVKAKMRSSEVLLAFNRSSNPGRGLVLANGVGVVDSDYFGNADNDGNIGFGYYNILPWDVKIKRGQKIGQGVFFSFLKTSEETEPRASRNGGFGSTGE